MTATGTAAMSTAEIYDPRTGKFTATSPLNDSRFKLPGEAVRSHPQLFIGGGNKQVEHFSKKESIGVVYTHR